MHQSVVFGAPGAQIRQHRLRLIVQDHPDKLIQTVVYTDSTEVLKEVAIRPGQGRSRTHRWRGDAEKRFLNGSRRERASTRTRPKRPLLFLGSESTRPKRKFKSRPAVSETVQQYITRQPYHPPPRSEPNHDRTQKPGISRGI